MTDEEKARWIRLVADFEASDLTQREFATERGISYTNLRNWIYRLRGKPRPLGDDDAKDADQGPGRDTAQEASRVVPVRVVASAPKARRETVAAGDGLLELALPSGARVRFPAGTDVAYVRALAAAL